MAESAVSFLFNELSIWIHEEQNLLGELKQEAEFIHGEIGQMRAFLRVADAKEESDPQLKEWVRQVREIANDTEDVLDRYMLQFAPHVAAQGLRGCLKKIYTSMKSLKATRKLASEMKTIRLRVENASRSHQTYRDKYPIMLSASSSSNFGRNTSYDGRGDALRLEEIDVVGIERPKEELLEWLSSFNCGLKVISVVGMAGLGKTTLVKKVYDDALVRMNFDHHAWVTVSESFKVENILEDIIKRLVVKDKQLPPPGLETMNDDDKREFIYNFLQNKNYIIVLDDIWRVDGWEAVKYAFPRSNTSGRSGRGCIIITTRFNNIGSAACSENNGYLYKLKPLTEEDSTKLFYKKAFSGNVCPHLEGISKCILKRCEGLPLAIVVIGGLLATKNNRIEEWEMFNRSLNSELLEDNLKRLSRLISHSFYDLPYYLKSCFLYLSIFQEDQMIEKATIIRLWAAEGFVEPKRGKTVEDIAEGYLSELVNRSLIEVVDTSDDGRSRDFHIHDLVREYIISKAREQNIAATDNGGEIQWADRIRRLALYSSNIKCTQRTVFNFEHLRSLLFLGPVDSDWLEMLYKVLCGGSRMLKVLDLRGAPLETIPNEVFKLYHLKYLSLRDTQVKVIPRLIRNLEKLETLDLKRSMVMELPVEILKLQRLRNLLVYRYKGYSALHPFDSIQSFKAPYEMGHLLCLRKLCYIDADDIKVVRGIGKLTQLHRLGITKLRREDGKELCASLSNLTNLRSLTILSETDDELMDLDYSLSPSTTFPFLRSLELRGCLEKVPQWISFLNALSRINLRWNRLQEDPLEILQGLPSLQILLMECAYEGQGLSFKAGGFQKLKNLYIKRLRELRWVIVEKGSMPLLQRLEFWDCKLMVELPVGIEHLIHLQRVDVMDMPEEFVQRVLDETKRKQDQDQWKNSHLAIFEVPNWT